MLTCPNCGRATVELGAMIADNSDSYVQRASCNDCGCEWTQEYELEFVPIKHWDVNKPLLGADHAQPGS